MMMMLRFVVNMEEEGEQNVSLIKYVAVFQLTAEINMKAWMTGGGGGSCRRCCFFIFVCALLSSSHFIPHLQSVFILVRGSLMKAGGGWREPPAVACSSRNAA